MQMVEKLKEQKTKIEAENIGEKDDKGNKKEARQKDNFLLIIFSVIFFWGGTEFCKSSWYMIVREFVVFRTVLYGVNKLGWISGCLGYTLPDFIRGKWVENKKINMVLRIVSYTLVLSFSFLLGIGSKESIDFQKKVEEAVERPIRGEEISNLQEEGERINSEVVSFDGTIEWEMEVYYKLSIEELKEEDFVGKVLYFHRWLYGKLLGVDKLLESIEISYEVYREEKMVNVVDRLVSYEDKQLYIDNPNIEQGEIRYKLLNEEDWSEWIAVGELKDGRIEINQDIEMLNWKLGEREEEFVVVKDETEILFFSIGEEYVVDETLLEKIIHEIGNNRQIDFEDCDMNFRFKEEVKGDREYFQKKQKLDLKELKLKSGEKIVIRCYIDDQLKGTYSVEQLGDKKEIERFYLNEVDEKQPINAVIEMELYMYERE